MNFTELKDWISSAGKLKGSDIAGLVLMRIVNTLTSAVKHGVITSEEKRELHEYAMITLGFVEEV